MQCEFDFSQKLINNCLLKSIQHLQQEMQRDVKVRAKVLSKIESLVLKGLSAHLSKTGAKVF